MADGVTDGQETDNTIQNDNCSLLPEPVTPNAAGMPQIVMEMQVMAARNYRWNKSIDPIGSRYRRRWVVDADEVRDGTNQIATVRYQLPNFSAKCSLECCRL
jgi:hypothetical protein